MRMQATVLHVDGSTTSKVFDGDPPLAWLQEQVGGYIELVPGIPQKVVINEEAALRGLPVNDLAAERLGDVVGSIDGNLRGNVVIIEPLH